MPRIFGITSLGPSVAHSTSRLGHDSSPLRGLGLAHEPSMDDPMACLMGPPLGSETVGRYNLVSGTLEPTPPEDYPPHAKHPIDRQGEPQVLQPRTKQ